MLDPDDVSSPAALILAAGASTRMGFPKQTAILQGETLLDRTIRTAVGADCSPIYVVLGAQEEYIRSRCKLEAVRILSHRGWESGIGTSLAFGIGALKRASGVLVMTCDMPAVTSQHLRSLAASGQLTASSYADRRGVPVYFPSQYFESLLRLVSDSGARELLHAAETIPLPGGECDVDTEEDLNRADELSDPSRRGMPPTPVRG